MSALARYFKEKGCNVSGYDKTKTALTNTLEQEGIKIHFDDDINSADKNAELIIYTPAIPKDTNLFRFFSSGDFNLLKRSDVLGLLTKENVNICIGGTHGKTTTSSMVAHILRNSSMGCTAFLGGIAANYNSNYWSSGEGVYVLEADEYDRSFHKLKPTIAVITAMDPDHLDIYGTEANLQEAFIQFGNSISKEGTLLINAALPRQNEFAVNKKTYSINEDADCKIMDLKHLDGGYTFNALVSGVSIEGLQLNMGGLHNVENALAAVSACTLVGASQKEIRQGLASYKGVRRRFEYVLKRDDLVIIDDYAHHPDELNALIEGVRDLFPNRHLTIVFQPHLYSRTSDFAAGFGKALSGADDIIMLPIYPARELPVSGVTSQLILDKIDNTPHKLVEKGDLNDLLKSNPREIIVMAGAGDIDAMVEGVKNLFNR